MSSGNATTVATVRPGMTSTETKFYRVTHDGRDAGTFTARDELHALDIYAQGQGFDDAEDMRDRLCTADPEVEDITGELFYEGMIGLGGIAYAGASLLAYAEAEHPGAIFLVTDAEVALLGQMLRDDVPDAVAEWRETVGPQRTDVTEIARNAIDDGVRSLDNYRTAAASAGDIETVAMIDLQRRVLAAAIAAVVRDDAHERG